MKKYFLIIVIFIFFSCINKKDEIILNDKFKYMLNSYIKKNPIRGLKIFGEEIAYPSYHVFFEKKNSDTIFAIKLLPHFTPFNLIDYNENIDSTQIFPEINPIGYFYINKNPIIIFDSNNYSKKVINIDILIKEIPDSLKFTVDKLNIHLKNQTEYFKLFDN